MKLRFFYQPVRDIEAALAFYCGVLGFEEGWREGSTTASVTLPGAQIGMLLDEDANEPPGGPFFVVDDVVAYYEQNRDRLDFAGEPSPIGPGMYARFTDPSGNVIRIMDDTTSRERS
jgi:catechol 2,3-dioxygenase-like lactoylglutathione lyase family enzyme